MWVEAFLGRMESGSWYHVKANWGCRCMVCRWNKFDVPFPCSPRALETVQRSEGTPDSSAKFTRRGRHEAAWDCGQKWSEGNNKINSEHSTNFASQSRTGRTGGTGYTCGMTRQCPAEASTMGTFCTSRGKQCLNIKECAARSNEPFPLWQVVSWLTKVL